MVPCVVSEYTSLTSQPSRCSEQRASLWIKRNYKWKKIINPKKMVWVHVMMALKMADRSCSSAVLISRKKRAVCVINAQGFALLSADSWLWWLIVSGLWQSQRKELLLMSSNPHQMDHPPARIITAQTRLTRPSPIPGAQDKIGKQVLSSQSFVTQSYNFAV